MINARRQSAMAGSAPEDMPKWQEKKDIDILI